MSSPDIDTLENHSLSVLARDIQAEILRLGDSLAWHKAQQWTTCHYANSRYQAKHIASMRFYRDHFVLFAHIINHNGRLADPTYDPIQIRTGEENYRKYMEEIKKSYVHLGGVLR